MAFLGIGALIAGAGTFFAGVIDFAVTMAVSVGLSYAAAALAGKPETPKAAGFSVQGTIQAGGAVPRSFNLGYSSTAGSLVYTNTWGNDGETPNAYVTQVIAISDLPGGTLQEVWVYGELCTLGADTGMGMGLPVTQYAKDGKDHLWVKYYDGTQTTADSFLTTKVGSADRPYESTRVGTGIAYVICTALVNDTLFTGFPKFNFAVSGIPLYDPTKDSTNGGSGSQRFSDPSTWGGDGDNLPAVQVYNILRGIRYGDQWMYGLQQSVQANLPNVNWNAQIAKCRDTIAAAGGDEPMYRSGGQIVVNSQPADALDALMTACQGKISEIGGFYKVHLGAPDSPTFSFTDDDILSTEEQTYDPFLTLAESINGISGTYPDPSQGWNTTTAPQFDVPDEYIRDGNRHLLANPAFDFVPYREQVQRLLKSAMAAALRERKHVITMPPVFWLVEPGDVGSWTSVRNGYADKQFIVDGLVDRANLDVTLSLQEVDPSDYDWTTGIDYIPGTSGPTSFPRPEPQGILDWAAEGVSILDADGYKRRPGIRLSWDGDMPGVNGIRYQVRRKDDASAVTSGNTLELAAGAIIITQSLLPDNEYEVAGQYIPSAPRDMLWSDWISVTTPDARLSLVDFDAAVTAQVTSILDEQFADVRKQIAKVATVASQALSRTFRDKTEVRSQQTSLYGTNKAFIETVQTTAADADAAMASDITNLFAGMDGNEGQINQTAIVAANASSAVSSLSSDVVAQIGTGGTGGALRASVTSNTTAVATLNDYAAASYSMTLDVNGYVTGYQLINGGGGISSFTVVGANFYVAFPGVTGGAAVPVFAVSNVGGVAKVALRGDMIVDGSITATKMNVATLTAISAAFGTATVSGTLSGTNGKMVIDFTNDRTRYSD